MSNDNITNFIINLSLEIRKERKKRNILTKDAARLLNLNSSTYSLLEIKPRKSTSLLKYSLMTNVLNISLSNILKRVYYEDVTINKSFTTSTEYKELNSEHLIRQVAQEIKHERIHKGMYQRELAHKIGIHRRYMSDIENGRSVQLSLYRFIEIAGALEVPLYVLVERAENTLTYENDKK